MQPKIIGIVGAIRSGKSSAARHLRDQYGYRVFSNSEVLRDIAVNLGIPQTRESLSKLGDSIFSVLGNDAIAKYRLSDEFEQPFVIDGIRYAEEIKAYRSEPTFKLLGLTAREFARHERASALAHEGKDQALDRFAFSQLALARSEVQVSKLVDTADIVISNDLAIQVFKDELDRVMKLWLAA